MKMFEERVELERKIRMRDLLILIVAPILVLLCSCGEPIRPPEDNEALLPDEVVASILSGTAAEPETTTTTVTVDPRWQENAIGNYYNKNGVVIEGVPHYTQFSSYFTACESFAAVSVLQYYGVKIDIDTFIDKYLSCAPYPDYGKDGKVHGASPWESFIGDPRDPGGFGCYNTAVTKAVNKIAKGLAVPLDGLSIDELCSDYIDRGQPVIFWGTIYMQRPYVSEFSWLLPDGTQYEFVNPEHALVLIGYDDDWYYFCDSMSDQEITPYNKQAVETAYEGLYQQAAVIDPVVLESLPESKRVPQEPEPELAMIDENGKEVFQ